MLRFGSLLDLIDSAFNEFSNQSVCEDQFGVYSYRDLEEKSRRMASFLTRFGIQPDDKVCICAPKSYESLTAIFGVVRASSTFVPIDFLWPDHRKCEVILDCFPKGMIADFEILESLSGLFPESKVIDIPDCSLYYLSFHFQQGMVDTSQDLAYILYTSGSSGLPKGVQITHLNSLSFIQWAATNFQFIKEDVFSSIAPFHFDLFIFDVFVPIWNGSKIILFDEKTIRNPLALSQLIEEKRITVWYSTPTVLILLNQHGKMHRNDHSSIRMTFYAGEVMPLVHIQKLVDQWTKSQFYNLYGPTETNVCTWHKIPEVIDDHFDVTVIGKCCSHVQCGVLIDDKVSPPSPWLRGELLVSGSSVSPGYLRQQNDSSAFRVDENAQKWYRTGDVVLVNEDGDFKYLGRNDRMIKKYGYRIELDEIEQKISKHPSIIRVGVIAKSTNESIAIKAVFQADQLNSEALEKSLISFACQQLPGYMTPDDWICVDTLPMTSTLKIDYSKLNADLN